MSSYDLSTIESATIQRNLDPQPCLGGRFRSLSDDKLVIQCNCPFKCTSRNRVWHKQFKYTKVPYYYSPDMNVDEVVNPSHHYNLRPSSALRVPRYLAEKYVLY